MSLVMITQNWLQNSYVSNAKFTCRYNDFWHDSLQSDVDVFPASLWNWYCDILVQIEKVRIDPHQR